MQLQVNWHFPGCGPFLFFSFSLLADCIGLTSGYGGLGFEREIPAAAISTVLWLVWSFVFSRLFCRFLFIFIFIFSVHYSTPESPEYSYTAY